MVDSKIIIERLNEHPAATWILAVRCNTTTRDMLNFMKQLEADGLVKRSKRLGSVYNIVWELS